MKKLLMVGLLLLTVGGGCSSALTDGEVRGPWRLAFDLPNGWMMVTPYTDKKSFETSTITPEFSEVVLQSTDKPALREVELPEKADTADYVTTGFTKIRVFSLYSGAQVPDTAENLGNGFYKVTACEGDACNGQIVQYQYYYSPTPTTKFKFFVIQDGQDISVAESIILSAKVVTQSTATETASNAEVDVQVQE